jgi:hypothetical protein
MPRTSAPDKFPRTVKCGHDPVKESAPHEVKELNTEFIKSRIRENLREGVPRSHISTHSQHSSETSLLRNLVSLEETPR